jgi:hypothetical protein
MELIVKYKETSLSILCLIMSVALSNCFLLEARSVRDRLTWITNMSQTVPSSNANFPRVETDGKSLSAYRGALTCFSVYTSEDVSK